MKRILLYLIMSFMTFTSYAQYVDLGLPSGTKWKKQNESGFYKYEEAVEKFGNKLPTKKQLEELKNYCTWVWTGKGYEVTGPNGNYIYFPANGSRDFVGDVYDVGKNGFYWSSTLDPNNSVAAYDLCFDSRQVGVSPSFYSFGQSVRLVQD